MPYEGNADSIHAAEFADQSSVIEALVDDNANCRLIIGDFNVDLSRDWLECSVQFLR
jgi:hypothetical protein